MKNRIRFAVTALAIILFAACFFVSCSDDVIVNKDNDHSYAEVLESNGAFVYNGQNYETLQGAIDAAAKAESQARAIDVQKEAITVTGNVKTREVVIPENADILMNLKGFEVSFFDVQTNAITVGKNSSFAAFNGTLAMADKQEGLVAISAGGENSKIELDSLKINAAGQTALLLDAGSATALSKSVSVEGTVIARGGEANTTLAMENSLSDVKLRGASLIVGGSGSAVITENSGENEFVVSPTATVIDQTGTIDPTVIEDSICYIVRKGELLTFGSLREAVASLEYDNETIVFIANETSTATESFTLSRPATVELNVFSAGVNNIVLADGANLTITGKAKNAKGTAYRSFAGTITSAEGAVASLVLNSVEMMGSVDISGSLTATETVFNSHLVANSGVSLENSEVKADLAIGSENGDVKLTNVTGKAGVISAPGKGKDVTIDNSKAKAALETGAIVADDIVAVKGNVDINVAVGEGVSGTSLNSEYATFEGAAVLAGKLTSADSVFEKTIRAGEIEDEGSTFKADLSALKGNLVLTGSYLDKVKEITSAAGGNITIVKSSGSIGKIETQAPDTEAKSEASGSVVVDNSESEEAIVIGDITAIGDITLTGNDDDATILTVTGSVSGKDFKAKSCTFDSTGETATITASTVRVDGSVFADGAKKISKPFYSIETTGKDSEAAYSLAIYSSTGRLGALNAKDGSVVVDNSESEKAIVIGDITAKDEIYTTGTKDFYLIVSGTVTAGTTVTDIDGTIFEKDITANGDITLTGSKFVTENEAKPAITSIAGNILMTKVTGTTGALSASGTGNDVTINNKDSGLITTGSITADDAVSLTGRTGNVVTAGAVQAVSLNASYAAVTGLVSLSGNLTSANSVFESAISAATVVDAGSTFKSAILTKANGGGAKFTGSVFASTDAQPVAVLSLSGNIEMTGVTGKSGNLRSDLGSVTIDNAQNTAPFETGAIKAAEAVSITGNTSTNVVIGADNEGLSVKASILDIVYATVKGKVELSGKLSSGNSVFEAEVSAASVKDNGSWFYSDITATTEDVTLTGSTIDSVLAPYPTVTSVLGNIVMTGVSGTTGALSASGTGNDVTINNKDSGLITTGSITADDAVSLTGRTGNVVTAGAVQAVSLNASYAAVTGLVSLSGNLTSANSVFESAISAATVVDAGSTFKSAILTKANGGGAKFTGSVFASTDAQPVAVLSLSGNIEMTGVTGKSGNLRSDLGSVTIDNAQNTAPFETGAIKAAEAVSITGNTSTNVVIGADNEGLSVKASILDIVYATVKGTVTLTGDMTSEKSVFNGAIKADAVVDVDSSFYAAIDAGSDVTLTGSVFYNSAPVTSSGNILMTKVTGTAGALTASSVGMDITINNADADAVLTTGAITADDAVSITGESSTVNVSVNGKVKGNTLDAVYVTVNNGYDVEIYGEMSSANSVFNGEVSADTIVDAGSTFSGAFAITADEDIVFENTKFVDSPSVSSESGDILMTKVTGSVGALAAYDITINNEKATAELTTGAITAENDISVTGAMSFGPGGISYNLTVGGNVRGASLDAVYANFSSENGYLNVSGDVTLSRSTFKNSPNVLSRAGNISLTEVSGEVGVLRVFASSVTIDNAQISSALTTNSIYADTVSVMGRLINNANSVTVAGVSASTLDVTYSTVTGEIDLSGNLTASYSTFSGTVEILGNLTSSYSTFSDSAKVSANAVVDTNSTIIGDITAENDITFENSYFYVSAEIESKNGNIEMTKTTGAVRTITASAYGSDVTINNALATDKFTTGRLTAGDAVSVTGNSDHVLTVAGVSASTLVADFATFSDSINAKYEVSLTNSVFAESADVISSSGSITMTKVTGLAGAITASSVNINNAEAAAKLETGVITATDGVTVNGNSRYNVTVAGVSGSSLDAVYAVFSGDIETSGEVSISESAFNSADADVKSSSDSIILTKVTGTAGTLTANGVTINNADVQLQGTVETSLTTGAIEAVGDVSVTGNSKHAVEVGGVSGSALDVTYAIVTGDVKLTGDLTSSYARFSNAVALSGNLESVNTTFEGNVTAATITAERGFFIRNTNVNSTTSITATSGDVTLTGSMLSGVNVASRNGKIEMTNVITETLLPAAGTLKASVVTIDNAQATGSLRTGAIEAVGGEVTVTGSSSHPVTVGGVTGNTLDAAYATIKGAVTLSGDLTAVNSAFEEGIVGVSGDLTATDSDFSGVVSASTITAERGSFAGGVTATTGDVKLSGTKFSSSSADVKSAFGNIEMTKVTGTAGSLEATNVTISNADATETLETGEIKAVGAVDLTGNSTYGVTAAGVSGTTLETTYATVTGGVGLSGALTSTDSVFKGNVSATVITDERGTFGDENATEQITVTATTGNVILNGSVFNGAGVTSTEGSILMTKVIRTAGDLEAYSVTINNDQTSDALETGVINSVGAVKVTGNSKYPVTVGGVTGTKLDADYAVISGDIEVATGGVTLTDSKFENEADVTATLGNITMTKVTGTAGDLSAYDAVTIDNSKVLGTTNTLSTGEIEANGAITLKGNDGHIVTVEKVNGQATMVADYVSVSEETILYGDLTSSNSTFYGWVSAATIEDTRSEFSGAVYVVGDVKLTGSTFNSNVADVLSWTGDIVMTGVSGTAGSLTTYGDEKTITIDNSKSFAPLTTGAVRSASAVPGAVTVTGNAYRQVTVDGSITGTTLVANYANLMGSINTKTSVTASNCTVGDGTTDDDVTSTTVSITGSRMKLDRLAADSVTITSPVLYATTPSSVSSIVAKNLSVTAENDKFSVGTVAASRMISIAGGTFTGEFTFSGSADSTISAGKFEGAFSHTGSATLAISGGFFTGTGSVQSLESGTTTIDGTYSSTWDVVFDNLSITGGTAIIKSGYFEAANATQLNNLSAYISQTSVSSSKFVDIAYTGSTIGYGSDAKTLNMPNSVKKVVVSFPESGSVIKDHLDFNYPNNSTYPDTVELKGCIVLEDNSYSIYSYNDRPLNNKSGYSIVYEPSGSSLIRINGVDQGDYYSYTYYTP